MRRDTVARELKPSAKDGSRVLENVPQPWTGKMVTPNTFRSCSARKYWSSAPMIKLGTETPIIATNMENVSQPEPRFTAATMPSSTPKMTAKSSARIPRSAETTKASLMMSLTGFEYVIEVPRSPRQTFPMYMKYCTITGLSRPYFAFMFSSAVPVTVLSPRKGSPGSIRIIKKVSVISTNSVRTA